MKNVVNIINDMIANNLFFVNRINYDMNALKLRLVQDEQSNKVIFFYIYSNWRLSKDNKIINSSFKYPHEQYYGNKASHRRSFLKYCGSTRYLEDNAIEKIEIDNKTKDLKVFWSTGELLEAFCFESNSTSYHVYDQINGHTYDVMYGKINKEFASPEGGCDGHESTRHTKRAAADPHG
ncbi:MAG: hypothetical protein WC708_12175 [Lentisphaeria bacterium]